jgi:hypothetical protein
MKTRLKDRQIINALAKKKIELINLDIDKHPDYAKICEVKVVPTFLLVQSRKQDDRYDVLKRQSGAMSVTEFLEFIS